ncbi:MAG TPA: SRPBCC family protein [Acidimicrobiales bacterium]|nr:SRPBCC family protein [Acidimicrobiales bacterium]
MVERVEVAVAEQVIEHEVTSAAPPGAVYALLVDGSTWPSWTDFDSFELVDAGDGVPEGVGAVRIFHTKRISSRERVVRAEPDRLFSYVLESGMPLRDYVAVVTLTPNGTGTTIRWRSTFRVKFPGTGWLYKSQLGRFIGQVAKDLAVAAERSRVEGQA